MKKIAKLFSFVAVAAAACGYYSINSTNEVICSNVEALTEEWDGRTLKANEHVAYSRFFCGNTNHKWTFKWENGQATSKCEWNDEPEGPIGVCVVVD